MEFYKNLKNVYWSNGEENLKLYQETPLHIPPPPPDGNYTQEELQEAIKKLHLPTWTRSYIPCDDNRSEVTCWQIVKAWRTIHSYENFIHNTKFEEHDHFLMSHFYDGIGNRMSTDVTAFLIALAGKRTFIVNSSYPVNYKMQPGQSYTYNDIVFNYEKYKNHFPQNLMFAEINSFQPFFYYNFSSNELGKYITETRIMYATYGYLNRVLFYYAKENFGMHAAYFISNYLTMIPEKAREAARKAYKNVPVNVRVIGVHLRFQYPGQFYSHNISSTINAVKRFLDAKISEKPTMFAFASDSKQMEKAFMKLYWRRTIKTSAIRIPDFDHDSALIDIAMLEMADELLLTYRSTFSYVVAMRTGKRAWFVEKESPDVFQATNSQAGGISSLFHRYDVNDWQLNRRLIVVSENKEATEYYYKYFLL